MDSALTCPLCEGAVASTGDTGTATQEYRCVNCGHAFFVRIHFIENWKPTGIPSYRALVYAGVLVVEKKNRIKVKKVFQGMRNFTLYDFEKQVTRRQPIWDLGIYSSDEVEMLKEAAKKIELEVQFVLTED